jgi:hypothetical protein
MLVLRRENSPDLEDITPVLWMFSVFPLSLNELLLMFSTSRLSLTTPATKPRDN